MRTAGQQENVGCGQVEYCLSTQLTREEIGLQNQADLDGAPQDEKGKGKLLSEVAMTSSNSPDNSVAPMSMSKAIVDKRTSGASRTSLSFVDRKLSNSFGSNSQEMNEFCSHQCHRTFITSGK